MVEKDELRGHAFDGIEEYDNDLPRWWLNIFWITTIFAIGYIVWAHGGFKDPDHVRLSKRLEELKQLQPKPAQPAGESAADPTENLLKLASSDAAVAKGKELYTAKCLACHGAAGEGLVGPNLTDRFWIHGASITDIHEVVVNGVPEMGMLPWKGLMTPEEISQVVAFVWTLRGTNPPNAKEPQGVEYDSDGNPVEAQKEEPKTAE